MLLLVNTGSDSLPSGLRRLCAHFTQRRRRQFLLVLALMLVGAVAELASIGAVLPFLALLADPDGGASYPALQSLFSALGWNGTSQILVPATLLFGAVALTAGAIRLVLAWVSQRFVFRLGYDLGVEVYRRTLYQPYSYHVAHNTSELIAGINKVHMVTFGVLLPLMLSIIGAIISVFILAALITIDAKIAFAAVFGFGLIYLGVSYVTSGRLKANSTVIAKAHRQRVQIVQEGLGGIRDVLIDQAQPVYLDKFKVVNSDLTDAQTVNAFIGTAPRFVIEASGIVLIGMLALVLSRGSAGIASALPVLGALALGAQRLLPLLQLIYNGWTQIAGNRRALIDILDILDQPIHARHTTIGDRAYGPFQREISLESVRFGYTKDGPLILDDFTLKIEKGARIGFIGMTGSGKSTLMDLVMGLLEPTAGEIRIDGELLSAENVHGWQAQIAHVPQAIYLADTTIAENIAFGIPPEEIDLGRLSDAAMRAKISVFIQSLSDGYKTVVGERGIRLSGGQRQRIGIARALYKQASVLVFDEATSALDSETEAAVMAAIQSLDRDLTILIIAHRLSTVDLCEKIVKLDEGRIVAVGSPVSVIQSETNQITHSSPSSESKKYAL